MHLRHHEHVAREERGAVEKSKRALVFAHHVRAGRALHDRAEDASGRHFFDFRRRTRKAATSRTSARPITNRANVSPLPPPRVTMSVRSAAAMMAGTIPRSVP